MTRKLCVISTRQEIDLCTSADYPPIPFRNMDWSAIDSNTYDASYEGEDENGHHWSCGISGHGEKEIEAVNDLIDQLEEEGS